MQKVNTNAIPDQTWSSPKGTFGGTSREVSVALGRDPASLNLNERHPFDVEITRLAPGVKPFPYHSHSAQWEFYHVISGRGYVRHEGGRTPIEPGDAFIFKPGEPHQLVGEGTDDLVVYVVADNPIGESCYYPDSNKYAVESPQDAVLRHAPAKYYDDEE